MAFPDDILQVLESVKGWKEIQAAPAPHQCVGAAGGAIGSEARLLTRNESREPTADRRVIMPMTV